MIVKVENVPIMYLDETGFSLSSISPDAKFVIPPYVIIKSRHSTSGNPEIGLAKIQNTGPYLAADLVFYQDFVPIFSSLVPYYEGKILDQNDGKITGIRIDAIDFEMPGMYYGTDSRVTQLGNYQWLFIEEME